LSVVNRGQRTRELDKALPCNRDFSHFWAQLACADFAQLDVQSAAADHDVLRTASSRIASWIAQRLISLTNRPMTDHQFQLLLRHLQVIIAILGLMAGVLIALAWTHL
jgi:hypothetical protein